MALQQAQPSVAATSQTAESSVALSSGGGPITASHFTKETALSNLRRNWSELLRDSSADSFFLNWEWLAFWWSVVARDKSLDLVVAHNGSDVEAIAPLCRSRGALSPLEFMGTGFIGSDYLDVICRDDSQDAAINAIAGKLTDIGRPVVFDQLRGDTYPAARRVAERLEDSGWTIVIDQINVCPYIKLDFETFDDYLATLSSSHRANYRRRLRKLKENFDFEFELVETEAQREEAIETLIHLHKARWEDKDGETDAMHLQRLTDFHREITQVALRNGWLRLFIMKLDGKPVSSLYGFRYGPKFLFYQSGFDPEYGHLSTGLVTMGLTIKHALHEGAEEYDLLRGGERYKMHWTKTTRSLHQIRAFPPGLVGRGLEYRYRARKQLSRYAHQVADGLEDAKAELSARLNGGPSK